MLLSEKIRLELQSINAELAAALADERKAIEERAASAKVCQFHEAAAADRRASAARGAASEARARFAAAEDRLRVAIEAEVAVASQG